MTRSIDHTYGSSIELYSSQARRVSFDSVGMTLRNPLHSTRNARKVIHESGRADATMSSRIYSVYAHIDRRSIWICVASDEIPKA